MDWFFHFIVSLGQRSQFLMKQSQFFEIFRSIKNRPIYYRLHWTTKFFEKCVHHETIMFFYVFWGGDFENDIENFVVSMVLPLFEVI